ncbi:MAG: ribonuclease R, partial [Gammaproteobacteria bacterium]
MKMLSPRSRYILDHPWRFIRQIVTGFRANQGFLLAGAVAYYTLLSIVPMF